MAATTVRRLLGACALALAAFHAQAQTDAATAEALMRQSGLWQQLAGMPDQVKSGFMAAVAQSGTTPSASETQRIGRAIDAAYEVGKLRAVGQKWIARGVQPEQARVLRRWYATPTGQKITRLEEAASADPGDPQALIEEGSKLLAAAPSTRRALLMDLASAARAAEMAAQITINTAVGVQSGLMSMQPSGSAPSGPSAAELREALEAQRPQLVRTFTALALGSFAKTYADVPPAELRQYVNFLQSDAGRRFTELGNQAIDAALVEASTDLGRRLRFTRDGANS